VCLGFVLGDFIYILSPRHELHRECAAHHGLAGMQYLKSVCPLITKALFVVQRCPNFLGRETACSLDKTVWHLGTPIGKPVEWRLRRVIDQFLLGKREQLGMCITGRENKDDTNDPDQISSERERSYLQRCHSISSEVKLCLPASLQFYVANRLMRYKSRAEGCTDEE